CAVGATSISHAFTGGGPANSDILASGGIQVRATEGGALPSSGTILRTSANPGNAVITGIATNATSFGALSQAVGALRLFVVLPGQTFTDATNVAASGISGSPSAQAAGT